MRGAEEHERLNDEELHDLIQKIHNLYADEYDVVEKVYKDISGEYKENIKKICNNLKDIAVKLRTYNICGYDFSSSLALKKLRKIQLQNVSSLEKSVQDTKKEKSEWVEKEIRNPIKDVEFKKHQIFKRLYQYFAPDTIEVVTQIHWEEYSLESIQKYITDTTNELWELLSEMEKNYNNVIDKMKENALGMADAVVKDVTNIVVNIAAYKDQINKLGHKSEELNKEIRRCNKTIHWLDQLINRISEGGKVNE